MPRAQSVSSGNSQVEGIPSKTLDSGIRFGIARSAGAEGPRVTFKHVLFYENLESRLTGLADRD